MDISPTSLLSGQISSTILIFLACFILKNGRGLKFVGRYAHIFLAAIVVRMAVPAEFKFTVTLISKRILTNLQDLMLYEVGMGGHKCSFGQALLAVWAVTAAGYLFLLLWEYMHFLQIVNQCPRYQEQGALDAIQRVNQECGKRKKFEVRFAPFVQTPAIFGLVRPVILMPGTDYIGEDYYYILKHEMLHYYHHDMLAKAVCEVLCAIYWWNPAVYLLQRAAASAMEIQVDCSLASGLSPKEKISYMECIVRAMKEGEGKKEEEFLISFAPGNSSMMKQRFQCIWESQWEQKRWKGAAAALLSVLLYLASASIIVEPYYDYELPGIFSEPDPETSFLIEKDGYYEFYLDGSYYGDCYEIKGPALELKVYKSMEERLNEK